MEIKLSQEATRGIEIIKRISELAGEFQQLSIKLADKSAHEHNLVGSLGIALYSPLGNRWLLTFAGSDWQLEGVRGELTKMLSELKVS
jgi:hypothetical protein